MTFADVFYIVFGFALSLLYDTVFDLIARAKRGKPEGKSDGQ